MNIFQKTYINLINQWNQQVILQSLNSDILQNQKIPEEFKQQILDISDPKEKKMILHFVSKDYQINEKNLGTLKQAFNDLNRFKLNYQQFKTPEQMMNSVSSRKQKNNKSYGPQSFPGIITHKVDQGEGITTYWVQDSPEGQMAVRKIIDSQLGYDRNFWCLETRNGAAKKRWGNQVNDLTSEQKKELGFDDSDDSLSIAWNFWKQYSKYPKRIAFQNGKIYAFSANDRDEIIWWNLDNEKSKQFPNHFDLKDKDQQYFKNLPIKFRLHNNMNLSEEQIRKLADDNDQQVKIYITGRNDLPEDVIRKLADDKNSDVRGGIAKRKDLQEDLIRKLANDKNIFVRYKIAERKDLPKDVIRKLADDKIYDIRSAIAKTDDFLLEDVIRKLANDENLIIRSVIAKRKDLHEDLIRKLADDESYSVRSRIAGRKNLSEDLIRKLADDEEWAVRYSIAKRKNLSKDLIKKLANDENQKVRNAIKQVYNI